VGIVDIGGSPQCMVYGHYDTGFCSDDFSKKPSAVTEVALVCFPCEDCATLLYQSSLPFSSLSLVTPFHRVSVNNL